MHARETNEDADNLALRALVWILVEPERALRLLEVTGLDPRDLRTRVGDPAVLGAALSFLEAHEPDLVACAAALSVSPQAIVAARQRIDGGEPDA